MTSRKQQTKWLMITGALALSLGLGVAYLNTASADETGTIASLVQKARATFTKNASQAAQEQAPRAAEASAAAGDLQHPYDADKPLPAEEEKKFYTEIQSLFENKAYSSLNEEEVNSLLSKLNERRKSGLRSIVETLSRPPEEPKQSYQRLFLIDYLNYRSRWDEQAKAEIQKLIVQDLNDVTDDISLAAMIGDRVDMVHGLAASDWEKALEVIEKIPGELLKKRASVEAYLVAIGKGVAKEDAVNDIRKIYPQFKGDTLGVEPKKS